MSTIWEQVTAGAKLISLPDIYLRLRDVLDDPEFSMSDVADVDYGNAVRRGVVTRNGEKEVHDLVLATSVTETFDGISSDVMDMSRYWRRSVHCGVLSRLLANKCNVLDSERLFVAGMLRDIGHLIMYQTVPELSLQAMEQASETGQPLFKVEQEVIGLNYARVGGALMRQWDLPRSLTQATEFHVEPGRTEENALETAIVHLAALMAESADAGEGPEIWSERVDQVAWQTTSLTLSQCIECMSEADGQIDQVVQLIFPAQNRAVG